MCDESEQGPFYNILYPYCLFLEAEILPHIAEALDLTTDELRVELDPYSDSHLHTRIISTKRRRSSNGHFLLPPDIIYSHSFALLPGNSRILVSTSVCTYVPWQNKGVGLLMLLAREAFFAAEDAFTAILATVNAGNTSERHLIEDAGYELVTSKLHSNDPRELYNKVCMYLLHLK